MTIDDYSPLFAIIRTIRYSDTRCRPRNVGHKLNRNARYNYKNIQTKHHIGLFSMQMTKGKRQQQRQSNDNSK